MAASLAASRDSAGEIDLSELTIKDARHMRITTSSPKTYESNLNQVKKWVREEYEELGLLEPCSFDEVKDGWTIDLRAFEYDDCHPKKSDHNSISSHVMKKQEDGTLEVCTYNGVCVRRYRDLNVVACIMCWKKMKSEAAVTVAPQVDHEASAGVTTRRRANNGGVRSYALREELRDLQATLRQQLRECEFGRMNDGVYQTQELKIGQGTATVCPSAEQTTSKRQQVLALYK
ncbi:hypothetical protein SPRG_17443 [Saprolegnia parasitica CBS 223.65]|uniref:Uncharacterized protein n=1 Tax=Saprolegnia parasitica (strain CBS 223.65) TaxID=695850 RepID=A0A067BG00_SAPPC|nr:hypothetical protein SPRG_17443 [Saprolegnia parasitica CBS 223.65]KDO17083.1 hypothetical protein SPRG_17443 [Saprolegnia parasitica CBS 223.65]|eukprot:XP_012212209.1 hypothetical protein SPRG_17443 [Saprolegnia parasitica CBS 223.65]